MIWWVNLGMIIGLILNNLILIREDFNQAFKKEFPTLLREWVAANSPRLPPSIEKIPAAVADTIIIS